MLLAARQGGCSSQEARLWTSLRDPYDSANLNRRQGNVDGALKPISERDIVEILTPPTTSRDWLGFVKTARARNKIRHVINASEREKAIDLGQKLIEREARRMGVGLSRVTRSQMETVAGEYGYSKIEDLQAALGWGKFSARQVIAKLAPESVPPEPPPALPPTTQQAEQNAQWQDPGKDYVIQVKGINDLLLTAQVLQPIRGEPIVGYITRQSVAVHSLTARTSRTYV